MISHELKVIFIHVPKSGGSSISKALKECGRGFESLTLNDFSIERLPPVCHGYRGVNAWNAKHIPARYLTPVYKDYFKFAFVRNPWDLVVSSYYWWIQNTKIEFRKLQGAIIHKMGFHDYVMSPYTDHINEIHHAGMGQSYFILDNDNRHDCVDMVGRFEKLDDDFERVCEVIDLPKLRLAKVNTSNHAAYPAYYDQLSAEMIARKFAWDIDRFGYRYGGNDHSIIDNDIWLERLRSRIKQFE